MTGMTDRGRQHVTNQQPARAVDRTADMSRRRMLMWAASGAVGLAADALTGCSRPARAEPGHEPPGGPGSDSFSPNTAENPDEISTVANPVSASPIPTRARPVYKVHDLLPDAPANAVALTIDDGPDPRWTPQVLDLLSRYHVQVTFSLVGIEAHTQRNLVRRIVAEGHAICNHTMTHPQPFAHRPPEQIDKEIAQAQSVIVDAAGTVPRLFRSPGGNWSPTVLATAAHYGMTPIDWDIDPRDWARPDPPTITRRLLAARPGDILLCHDGGGNRAQTVEALRTVLPTLTGKGYTFLTL